jgi:uncharacterized membrane protein YfcA
MPSIDLATLALAAFAAFLATVAQLVSGFGFNLTLVPLLLVVLAPADAVVVASLLSGAVTAVLAFRERAQVAWDHARWLIAGACVGVPIGLHVLSSLAPRALTWLIVVVVLGSLAVVLTRVTLRGGRPATVLAGALSGALLTSTAMNGPPLVAVLRAAGLPDRQYRATLALLLSAGSWVGFASFVAVGRVNAMALAAIAAGAVGLPIGYAVGERLFARMDAQMLRRAIIAMLLACLVTVLLRG